MQVGQIGSSVVLRGCLAYVWWWDGEGGHICGGLLRGLWVPGVGGALVSGGGVGNGALMWDCPQVGPRAGGTHGNGDKVVVYSYFAVILRGGGPSCWYP